MLNIQPREKQIVALNMLRGAWKKNNSFMLYAPVGFGKTAIAALIADGFVSRQMRVMFVAPYTVLLDQTAARFMEYGLPGEEISYVWRDHPSYNPTALIQIASADTLIRREFPDNIDLLIVDEAHLKRKKLLEVIDNLTRNTASDRSFRYAVREVPGKLLPAPHQTNDDERADRYRGAEQV